jgi:hypothetical protein
MSVGNDRGDGENKMPGAGGDAGSPQLRPGRNAANDKREDI